MAQILFSTRTVINPDKGFSHDARMVPAPQYINSNESSVVRIDVLAPGEVDDPLTGAKKVKAKLMHTAYWLDPDEAIQLAEALKAAAVLVKHHDETDRQLFEEIRLQRHLNER